MNNPPLINPYQPVRPRITEEGDLLRFRTRPKKCKKLFALHTVAHQVCALSLYRSARGGFVPKRVAIRELFDWLDIGLFNKRNLGNVVVNSVIYEPRVLLNRKDTGPMMTYSFLDVKELEFGLEWMVCIILRKLMKDIESPEEMAEELDMLSAASEADFQEVYLDGLYELEPFYWLAHSEKHGWEFKEVLPEVQKNKTPEEPPAPPRDLS